MTETVVSTIITSLDASPSVRPVAGEGGASPIMYIDDNFVTTTGEAAGSTYRCCPNIPRNAHIKAVKVWLDAEATTFTADINLAWSNDVATQAGYQGTIPQISSANNKLFGAAVALGDVLVPTDYISGNTTNFPSGSNMQPVWEVLGYTVDPGGSFNLLFENTATNSEAAKVNVSVGYTLP